MRLIWCSVSQTGSWGKPGVIIVSILRPENLISPPPPPPLQLHTEILAILDTGSILSQYTITLFSSSTPKYLLKFNTLPEDQKPIEDKIAPKTSTSLRKSWEKASARISNKDVIRYTHEVTVSQLVGRYFTSRAEKVFQENSKLNKTKTRWEDRMKSWALCHCVTSQYFTWNTIFNFCQVLCNFPPNIKHFWTFYF